MLYDPEVDSMNDQAVAYGFMTFIVLLVVAAIAWIIWIPVVNGYSDTLNDISSHGRVSEQTMLTFGVAKSLIQYGWLVITILVGFAYAVIRALEQKRLAT